VNGYPVVTISAADIHASTPLSNWRADRTLMIVRVAAIPAASWLVGLALTGLVLIFPVAATSFITLSLGFTAVLLSGRHHAWIIYLFATYQLARQHRLPRRLMPFLDDAHRLGLLRTVGPIYQFRHADLQDHLAATYRPHD
jgi:hypothetical protein